MVLSNAEQSSREFLRYVDDGAEWPSARWDILSSWERIFARYISRAESLESNCF